jgi:cysteine desulfurase family protein (TIGR01976 family)
VPADTDAIRRSFTSLSRKGTDGRPLVFLDGPGGAQVPDVVIDAMADYLRNSNANIDGAFVTSEETTVLVDATRVAASDFLGCTPEEVIFGPNMTTINFNLVHSFCRTLEPGDEIVVTGLDHDANVSPWLVCAKDHGLVVRVADVVDGDLQVEPSALEKVVGPRTKVCAFTLASNAIGTMPNAKALSDIAHSVGALAWMDCVHYAPHRRIDVKALGADVLLCSPYKYFGPHQGLGYARRDLLEAWPADRVRPAAQTPAGHRFETGTMSHESLAGVLAAIDFIASLGEGADRRAKLDAAFRDIVAYETGLTERMLDGLAEIPGMTLYGITDPARAGERTPTFTFTLPGITPRQVCEQLAQRGILGWDGNYYALGIMDRLGLEGRGGATRLGFLRYTTEEEVERTLEAIGEIARG